VSWLNQLCQYSGRGGGGGRGRGGGRRSNNFGSRDVRYHNRDDNGGASGGGRGRGNPNGNGAAYGGYGGGYGKLNVLSDKRPYNVLRDSLNNSSFASRG
jgi:hypothetical protein